MHHLLHFLVFMHLHLAFHLGTLAKTRERCGVGAKPEDGVWWNYPEDGSTQRVSSDQH
jgi:hypothetical protein